MALQLVRMKSTASELSPYVVAAAAAAEKNNAAERREKWNEFIAFGTWKFGAISWEKRQADDVG